LIPLAKMRHPRSDGIRAVVTTRSIARLGQVRLVWTSRAILRWALASRVAARHNGTFRAKRQSAMPSLRRCPRPVSRGNQVHAQLLNSIAAIFRLIIFRGFFRATAYQHA
jgi:hypothetical protein